MRHLLIIVKCLIFINLSIDAADIAADPIRPAKGYEVVFTVYQHYIPKGPRFAAQKACCGLSRANTHTEYGFLSCLIIIWSDLSLKKPSHRLYPVSVILIAAPAAAGRTAIRYR